MRKNIKVVLVGCGGISRTWLSAIKEIRALEIVGLVDLVKENAQKRASEFSLTEVVIGDNLSSVLAKTHPDAVFDCTVPEAHAATTLEALRFGCHVLGEKPMASSMDEARRMIEQARVSGKIYAVTQNYRYNADIRRLKQTISSGQVGPLTTLSGDFYIGAHFGGFRDVMPHVLLQDMAIHTFDAARFITGADPLTVYCKEWNPEGSWYAHGASAIAIFEMTGGIVFSYRGSWCAEGLLTPWNSEWRVIGQKGSIKWDGSGNIEGQVVAETGAFHSKFARVQLTPEVDPLENSGHLALITEFVAAVQAGVTPETICSDNIKSLAMVYAAIQSAETGRKVEIVI